MSHIKRAAGYVGKHHAIVVRISQDKDGRGEGVDNQEDWGTEYAEEHWDDDLPIVVYRDNDVSAAKQRPEDSDYNKLKAALGRRDVVNMWARSQDRLERQGLIEWFGFAALMVSAGVPVLHTRTEGIKQVDSVVAQITSVLNQFEVKKALKNLNDRLDKNAAKGQPAGSRPFGYRHAKNGHGKTYEVVESEADAIRYAAKQVLAGSSLTTVAAELREQGVVGAHRAKVRDDKGQVVTDELGDPLTRPTAITAGTVRDMLLAPTIASLRVHRGVITDVAGNWPAIITRDEWQVLRAKLTKPRTVKRRDGGTYEVGPAHKGSTGRRYLLTGGVAVCGVCGRPLIGSMKQLRNSRGIAKHTPYLLCKPLSEGHEYVSRANGGTGGCVGIMMPEVDEFVLGEMWQVLDQPDFLARIKADPSVSRREQIGVALEALDVRRADLSKLWARGERSLLEWDEAKQALDERQQELEDALTAIPPPPADADIATVKAAWEDLDLGVKRAFIRRWVRKVTILPAVPGTKGFDDGRVDIDWL